MLIYIVLQHHYNIYAVHVQWEKPRGYLQMLNKPRTLYELTFLVRHLVIKDLHRRAVEILKLIQLSGSISADHVEMVISKT